MSIRFLNTLLSVSSKLSYPHHKKSESLEFTKSSKICSMEKSLVDIVSLGKLDKNVVAVLGDTSPLAFVLHYKLTLTTKLNKVKTRFFNFFQ